MQSLKYIGYSIVFQEVPDEISLAFNISGCPYCCDGCHSSHLWEYKGNYILEDILNIMKKYDGLITCVCFMGGDQNKIELKELIGLVKAKGLKTALYTGNDNPNFTMDLDYLKYGHYDKCLGGLTSKKTNQRMLRKNRTTNQWEDITNRFWK